MNKQPGHSLDEVFTELNKSADFRKARRKIRPYYDLVLQIIRRRSELNLTQRELADRADTHQSRISKIESAEHDIRLSTLIEIAEALETEVDIQLIPFSSKPAQVETSIVNAEPSDEAIQLFYWPGPGNCLQNFSVDAFASDLAEEVVP